jgi:hypothetical protein
MEVQVYKCNSKKKMFFLTLAPLKVIVMSQLVLLNERAWTGWTAEEEVDEGWTRAETLRWMLESISVGLALSL